MTTFKQSCIVISNNFDEEIEFLKLNIKEPLIFNFNEFNIDDARMIINISYIYSLEPRYIVIFANSYNIYAQNAMLKTLEDIPNNIIFLLFANSKNKFLPTILSRLMTIEHKKPESKIPDEFILKSHDAKSIYEFIKNIENKDLNQSENKIILKSLLKYALNLNLDSKSLNRFKMSLKYINVKQNSSLIFIPILLDLMNKGRK